MESENILRILFVEDLPTDVELAVRVLKKNQLDFIYKRVETKEDFLKELKNFHPDIVISDYSMPRFDGMTALKLLLEFNRDIPIVMLTGSTNEDTAVECLKAGALDYVIKEHITRLPFAVKDALRQSKIKTEKAKAENELKQKTEELDNYFTNALDLFCIADINGNFRRLNKAWESILGYSLSELEGKPYIDFVHPDDIESTKKASEELRGQQKVTGFVNRYRCKDGSYKWIEWRSVPGADLTYSAARNITERIESEAALRKSEMFKNDILNSLTGHLAVLDTQGNIISVNEFWEKFAIENNGTLASTGVGVNYFDVCKKAVDEGDGYAGRVVAGIKSVIKGELPVFILEYPCHSPSEKRWFSLRVSPMKKLNSGAVVYHENITERKQAEQQLKKSHDELEAALKKLNETQKQILFEEKMRSLGQMTSGICHDINNSLTPIMGYIDLLKADDSIDEKYSSTFNRIIKSTNDIAKTVSRLREFYRKDVSDSEMSIIDLKNLILETIELTKHRWKDMPNMSGAVININTWFPENLPEIEATENEIREALTNLIINACDAMPGGGLITISVTKKEPNISVEIKDSGIGMDDVTLQRCLDPFFTTKGSKGTGLGLSMVFGIMERHRGELKISSTPGKGTSVILIFPAKQKIGKRTAPEPAQEIRIPEKLKILTVEDDPVISDMLYLMLAKKGFSVIAASNGKTALEKYVEAIERNEVFDLIITDLGMGEMDGISFSRAIKKITPKTPIILLTGFGSLLQLEDHSTIDYLLSKPVLSSELIKAIGTLTSLKKNGT